jgi:hypothetical protein
MRHVYPCERRVMQLQRVRDEWPIFHWASIKRWKSKKSTLEGDFLQREQRRSSALEAIRTKQRADVMG